jgi:hypothetical protein
MTTNAIGESIKPKSLQFLSLSLFHLFVAIKPKSLQFCSLSLFHLFCCHQTKKLAIS